MGGLLPAGASERAEMLREIGCGSIDELFSPIPQEVRLKGLDIPQGMSELQAQRALRAMAKKNKVFDTIFRGAGAYRHYIPAVVGSVTGKEEFLTAYTPYQAEISQGVLQSIFEYQTMICELTGMEVSNASVYDGATAAAEAAAMCRERGRERVLVSSAAHPEVIETMRTYCFGCGMELTLIPERGGRTDLRALGGLLGADVACVYLQQPSFFGSIEDAEEAANLAHAAGAKLILGCNPIALGLLRTPAECGADIAVGEGQPLGIPLSFGGPYLGFMACTGKLMRRLPGRIVGETTDGKGERAFVLTLQAREQHIRREKASSNICSNQALCAMRAAVYLSAMGPGGLRQVAETCLSGAHYLAKRLSALPGFQVKNEGEFFHEFVTSCPVPPQVLTKRLEEAGILGGLPLGGAHEGEVLWCVTEMNTPQEIDRLVDVLKEFERGNAK